MPQTNQHRSNRILIKNFIPSDISLFSAPDESIKEPLQQYYKLGLLDVRITELLKEHYDTDNYGLRYVGPLIL